MALRSLSTGKQYKNVYTILEKVKKGEIKSHYKNEDGGLFGKLDFYKKTDLIKPHMHYIDEKRLSNIVSSYINDVSTSHKYYERFNKSAAYKTLADDKKPDWNTFQEKLQETYKKFPNHLKNDIFKMFYHKMEKLEFESRTDTNYTQYKFLERSNNPVGKIMTETSNLKSAIFTRNLMHYYIMQMTMMEYIDPDAAKQLMNGLNGQSDFDNQGLDELMSKMLDNRLSKNMMDDAIKDAQDTCKSMDDSLPQDVQDDMFNNTNGANAGNFSPDYLNQVAESIRRINLSLGSLKDKIKKLMDKSKNYFSAQKETIQDDLFNSDNVAGLDEYLFLHPKLRKFMVEDIMIKDTRPIGKINIYIDISGSMSDYCGVGANDGTRISKLDFCKAFAVKMQDLGMLNKIFIFNNNVKELKTDIFSIANLGTNGGTSINTVIDHVKRHDENALIVTDAEDHCRTYSEKAFFIGIKGARFDSFEKNTMKKYSENGQAVVFDGNRIFNVNASGGIKD